MEVINRFKQSLDGGRFVVTAEIAPTKGEDVLEFVEKASLLRDRVDAINVTDNQRAVMRVSSLAASALLGRLGIEPIYQLACRDRNRLALQSDLLGAHLLGIRNVLAITGDYMTAGDHPDAKPVYDLDSIQLVKAISDLNSGRDVEGKPLLGSTDLFCGAVVNPTQEPIELTKLRFRKKVEAGARFFQTQMVSDIGRFAEFMNFARGFDVKVIAGVVLIKSAKNAAFLNRNIPGVAIHEKTIERLDRAAAPIEEGISICAEQIRALRKVCDGVHIMAFKAEERILDILAAA